MSQATTNEFQYRGINRTICIGLGGTGRDVLMRIRRLIVDRYGDLSNLPIVSFIHIDTDKAATQVTGIRTGSTYHGVDLSFKEAEKVTATMSSNEVSMFIQGLERRSEYTRHGPYDHIGRWFPPQLLRNIKAVEEGAKGIRPVGRLAFFHNYQKIKTAIESAERRTRGHDSLLLKAGLKVEPGLSIFVVGSLCGGTGSGMFLDIAYSLRYLYRDESAKIFSYLIISPELYGNAPTMSANTYAALKELNYYSTPGRKFEAFYDLQNVEFISPEEGKRPPFDYTYLVSNQTGSEYLISDQGKLCNVIAHKIAMDFSSELAPAIKGSRDNFLQHMIQCDKHPRPNTQRYLTFGLAAIYFPRDTIVQIALNRVSLELVKFWLSGKGQSPDPLKLIEQFLIQNHWHNDPENKDYFTTKLAESVQENNKSFRNTLSAWRNKLEQQISQCQKREDRNDIRGQLPREFREQFRKVQPGETESTRGIWLTKLLQTSPNITKELKTHIDEYLSQLLTPTDANFSIKSTRDWLDALQHELHNYQLNLQEKITENGGMKIIEDLERKWRDTEQTIEDLEQKPVIPLLNNKNSQVQDEAKKSVQEACKIIQHNFDVTVVQEALKIVNQLQKHVQERATQVAAFNSLVEDLQSFYEKQDRDLRQLNFDEMSGEAIFDSEDIDSCYQTILPADDLRRQFVLVSSTITEPTGRGQSLASFIDRERTTIDQLQKEIDIKVDKLFASRSINIVNSVIKRFMQNYSLAVRSTRLSQVMQEAQPLLRLNLSDPYFREDPAKSSKLVGFKDTDDSEVRQFKTLLTQDIGVEPSVLKATQAEDEILVVNEYAGFPLRLISGLERMRNPYLREQHSASSFLHNDYNISFPDIIPPDAKKMEELEDIFYPCLALGLLKNNQENKQLEFQYYDQLRDSYNIAALSLEWSQALEELANRQDMTEALRQLLENEKSVIAREPQAWENRYLPKLREFVQEVDRLPEDNPNYPYKAAVIGTSPSTDPNPKEGIINRFRRKISEQFQNLQNRRIAPSTNTLNQPAINDEIVIDSPVDSINHQTPRLDYADDNRTQRRLALEQLKQDLADELISQEDFDHQKQKIINQYPYS